jgi:hypothetical protein
MNYQLLLVKFQKRRRPNNNDVQLTAKSIKPGRTKLLTKLDNNDVLFNVKKQPWERQMGLN